jgi:methionine synthase I (cobalamin-dependent)
MAKTHPNAVKLLDGGMGHLIKQWGVAIPGLPYDQQFLAGCLAVEAVPATVIRAHTAYIGAGCDIITTNNFVATLHNFAKLTKAAQHLQHCQVSRALQHEHCSLNRLLLARSSQAYTQLCCI